MNVPANDSLSFDALLMALKRDSLAAEAATIETFPAVVEARKWLERCERQARGRSAALKLQAWYDTRTVAARATLEAARRRLGV